MKASRAYLASIGTTGVLIAAAVVVLLVGSALVAYREWPSDGIAGDSDDVVLRDRGGLALDGPARAALDAAPAAAAVASRPAPGTPAAELHEGGPLTVAQAPGATGAPGTLVDQAPTGGGGGGPGSGSPGTPDPLGGGDAPPNAPGPAPSVGSLTRGAGETARGLTDRAGAGLGQVSPELGKGVTDTGRAVSDLVEGLGVRADEVLEP